MLWGSLAAAGRKAVDRAVLLQENDAMVCDGDRLGAMMSGKCAVQQRLRNAALLPDIQSV